MMTAAGAERQQPQRRSLLVLRTHRFDRTARALAAVLARARHADFVIACDNTNAETSITEHRCIYLTQNFIKESGLYLCRDAGWRCGDYTLYLARKQFPDYDHYWMVESDVFFGEKCFEKFDGHFDAVPDGLIACEFGPRAPHWHWHQTVSPWHARVYGCLFPLVRLSGAAVDVLLRRRVALTGQFAGRPPELWPNDEAFVATELMAAGFACSDINAHGETFCSREEFTFDTPRHLEEIQASHAAHRVYHPVLDGPSYVAKVRRTIEAAPFRIGEFVRPLAHHEGADALAAVFEEAAARQAIRLAEEVARVGPRGADNAALFALKAAQAAPELPHGGAFLRPGGGDGGSGSANGGAAAGWAHSAILARQKRYGHSTASPADFTLAPPLRQKRFPAGTATAYCLDPARREMLFACTYNGTRLFEPPFLYAAQFEAARSVVRVPLDRLDALYDGPGEAAAPPTVIMSIGRCGSTLLNAFCGVFSEITASEPDVFSQVAELKARGAAGSGPPLDAGDVLRALATAYRSILAYSGARSVTLKLRSQANVIAEEMVQVFPDANYVFVLRERGEWARSVARTFRVKPDYLVEELRNGILGYRALQRSGVRCTLLWYEDMVADPVATMRGVFGLERELSAAEAASLAALAARDAQAGSGISRAAVQAGARDEPALASVLDGFEGLWRDHRPASLIAELGLPY